MRRPGAFLADIRVANTQHMKTYSPKPEHIERRWYVIDASDKVLGRLASEAAALLRGKHKPIFAPHMDTGDHVIIVNADKVVSPAARRSRSSPTATRVPRRHHGDPIRRADAHTVRCSRWRRRSRACCPKNRLGRAMSRKLHVMAGPDHPHGAQRPVDYTARSAAGVGGPAGAEAGAS